FARSVTTKQTSPKDGRDCRADKSARKDAVNLRSNTLATRKSAFTLAEVLITLVIIGIVAAITVPTLMANYRKQEVSSRLKKFYSTLSNAVRLADMENPGFIKSTCSARYKDFGQWWNNNLGKYMPVEEKNNTTYKFSSGSATNATNPSKLYVLNDGTMFISYNNSGYNVTVKFLFDINGEKAPNVIGKDIFVFSIGDRYGSTDSRAIAKGVFVCADSGFCGLKYYNSTRDVLLKNCSSHYISDSCTKLLQTDGWQVKDDYPLAI
ncbi:MAG: type II secretion system GspH family protein, partial [Candidatus Gastranaerophilales bacterium]|nr:type II secretion system GspH family protein [Candidatus Gastranaerophilales bacterium]